MYLTRARSLRETRRRKARGLSWRILVIGDVHSPCEFEMPLQPREELDMVATLGDIPTGVMERVLWWARGTPVVGVPGNHDAEEVPGIVNAHGRVVEIAGLRIAGFGGARTYRQGPNQFRDWQVARQLYLMGPAEVFLSHAPPLSTSLSEGSVHRGFAAFDRYIERRRPRVWLHGHLTHAYHQWIGSTRVLGVVGKRLVTVEP
ncbi:MAG: metallophosphoesterase family protein [Gammaproteobacteria bacterium]|jgi:Icc-related predicted phosphoesterase